MNPKTPKEEYSGVLTVCPKCQKPPEIIKEDWNGYYYFDCENKDCNVGRVMMFTKALQQRLQDEGKFQNLIGTSLKKKVRKSLNREKVKGKEKTIDWTLILYIVLAILGIAFVLLS